MQEKISYLNKLNIQNNKSEQKDKEEYIPLGWVKLQNIKNKIIWKSKSKHNLDNKKTELAETDEVMRELLNTLTNLHQKRNTEYILKWGEEDFCNLFNFPNYDYSYFDKLDEKYETEMKILNEEEELNDDIHSNYLDYDEDIYS
jgi:hypothetical protein